MGDKVRIYVSWDSGPLGVYHQTDMPVTPRDGYGTSVVEVPAEVWARHEAARETCDEIENWLDALHGDPSLPPPSPITPEIGQS